MVKVITVEREYGSQGADFARDLAQRLSWKFIDRCLIDEIAQKAGVPKSIVENCDERLDPWYHKMNKGFWSGSVEHVPAPPVHEVFDSERMVQLVRGYLEEVVAAGECVIVGRGAACALAAVPHVFHIFVYASMSRKLRWFEQHFPGQAARGKQAIEAVDNRRASYIRSYYNQDWTDRRLYHMMINSCVGSDALIQAAIEAAGLGAQKVR